MAENGTTPSGGTGADRPAGGSTSKGVLDGVRVLDYGRFIAAPWCTAILADMGADVVRVEKREGGEDRWVQAVTEGGEGGTFLQCNRNKRSLTLDSTTPDGAEITRRLVAGADIVVANMPLAGMQASGLDYDTLRAVKADIILASATAYGEGGPYSDRIGFDGAGQVMSGATHRQGLPEQPIRTTVPYTDFGTAMTLAIGVMMALFHHRATGEGQHVEGALLPTALMMSNAFLIERDLLGVDKPRMGNRGTSVAPCDLYEVTDGWVLLQVAGQPMFRRWCRLIGREDLMDDPRFAGDDLRWQHSDFLNDLMQDWCRGRTKVEVLAALEQFKLPAAPMHSTQDVLEDPHVEKLGYLERIDYPGASKPVPIVGTPFRMSRTPGRIRRRAPLLGEHTGQILADLGYSPDEVADLRERQVV
ncbi:CaiB/BaiF CoA transferase family protein [Nocardia sp. NPDC055049]